MRTTLITLATLSAAGACGAPRRAAACTAFLLSEGAGDARRVAVAKSYDWHSGEALVLVNKRGVAKQALPAQPGDRPARWISRYASVTFNQYGREMPIGGMNERGLVVETLWLDSSRYPAPDQRPTLTELQWVQHQLDLFDSVKQVVAAAPKVRIAPVYAKVHYLVCDGTGACAAIENVDGKLVISAGKRLPTSVLTNDSYSDSLRFLRLHAGFGGARAAPHGRGSLARFTRAATLAAAAAKPHRAIEARAFEILRSVSLGAYSKWNIVYLPLSREVLFRTHRRATIRSVSLARLSSACDTPVQALDLDAPLSGDVTTRFSDYTPARNRALLAQTLASLAPRLPPGTLERLAAYPERLPCTARAPSAPRRPRGSQAR